MEKTTFLTRKMKHKSQNKKAKNKAPKPNKTTNNKTSLPNIIKPTGNIKENILSNMIRKKDFPLKDARIPLEPHLIQNVNPQHHSDTSLCTLPLTKLTNQLYSTSKENTTAT